MPVWAYENNGTTIRYKLAKFHTKNGGLGNCYSEGESVAKCSVECNDAAEMQR